MRRAKRLPLEELAPYLLETVSPSPLAGEGRGGGETRASTDPPPSPSPARGEGTNPLDWPAVFGNDRPVEIEVGFGKGQFLLTSALARPQVNFVGVEVLRKYQLFTATRLAKRNLRNVRVALGDARLFLRDRVATASVQAVHVYFPDPWWKKRHQKRRVFTPDFAVQVERVLRPGGRLWLATDVEEYFGIMSEILRQRCYLRKLEDQELPPTAEHQTNFERKARERGQAVFRAAYVREAVTSVAPSETCAPGFPASPSSPGSEGSR